MITVACVWVNGHVPYGVEYVEKLYHMVFRKLDEPFQFMVLTDRLAALDSIFSGELGAFIGGIPVTPPRGLKAWWTKLELFGPYVTGALQAAGARRVLYLDLDVLIVGDLRPMAHWPAPLVLCPPGGKFHPLGYRTVHRYNSSVMAFDVGAHPEIFSTFNRAYGLPGGDTPLWGDQDWIGELLPNLPTFPPEWVPRLGELPMTMPPSGQLVAARASGARVVLCKKPKPHIAAERIKWVSEIWC